MTQLKLHELKPLSGRLHIAVHLESAHIVPPGESGPNVDAIIATLQNECDLLNDTVVPASAQTGNGPLPEMDAALQKIASIADQRHAAITGQGDAADRMRGRLSDFSQALRAANCSQCVCAQRMPKPCADIDRDQDALNVADQGGCIKPLKDLEKFVRSKVEQAYRRAGKHYAPPAIDVHTSSVHRHTDRALFDEFNVAGQCEVSSQRAHASTVTLTVKRGTFDWRALCQTYYIFAHEFACHAYQGLSGARRENVDEKCFWSEGWMDRVAYKLAMTWLNGPSVPEFLRRNRSRAEGHCSALHERRYAPTTTLPAHDASRRDRARNSYGELDTAWQDADPDRALHFSLRLNLHELPQEPRTDIAGLINQVLEQEGTARYEFSIGACSRFLHSDDTQALLDDLSYAIMIP